MKGMKTLSMVLLAAGIMLTACNKKEPVQQVKQNGLPKAGQTAQQTCDVAVVNIDTLASQYEYCKEGLKQLEAKQKGYQQQLQAKGQALQNAAVAFQKKLQSGGYTSQQEAEKAQAQLQKQQQSLQSYQESIENEMMKATENYQKVLRDSLNNYLKDFNKDGRYKLILSRSGDNVLYAAPSVDITDEIVSGLNKRYKKK